MSFEFYIDNRYLGKHFILSPSSHILDKDRNEAELETLMYGRYAKDIGTCIHATAAACIRNHIRPSSKASLYDMLLKDLCEYRTENGGSIPRSLIDPNRYLQTVHLYIKDALTYDMTPEVPLVYSPKAGGTTDAIAFNERKRYLRIHDLKTGEKAAKMDQLAQYAAYFCLVYKMNPNDISFELRIYQGGEVFIDKPTATDIAPIMDRIKTESDYLMNYYGG